MENNCIRFYRSDTHPYSQQREGSEWNWKALTPTMRRKSTTRRQPFLISRRNECLTIYDGFHMTVMYFKLNNSQLIGDLSHSNVFIRPVTPLSHIHPITVLKLLKEQENISYKLTPTQVAAAAGYSKHVWPIQWKCSAYLTNDSLVETNVKPNLQFTTYA